MCGSGKTQRDTIVDTPLLCIIFHTIYRYGGIVHYPIYAGIVFKDLGTLLYRQIYMATSHNHYHESSDTMTEQIDELAETLENHASSRADFRSASESQRREIAKWLVIARVQVENSGDGNRDAYKIQLIEKRSRYFHVCGAAEISIEEATYLWSNVVYSNTKPTRTDLV